MNIKVSTHSRLKAAGLGMVSVKQRLTVSTHSRLKAAGTAPRVIRGKEISFNTQPPEGGWQKRESCRDMAHVSTHSRLKAAGSRVKLGSAIVVMFQHTAA